MINALVCLHMIEILFGEQKYIVSLKFDKGSGMREKSAFYLVMNGLSLSLYFQLYLKFKTPNTQSVENYSNPFGFFNLISKYYNFSEKWHVF